MRRPRRKAHRPRRRHPDLPARSQAPTGPKTWAEGGVSIDQIAARQIGKDTPLSSIELCGEPGGAVSYATPNAAAKEFITPENLKNTAIYPSDEQMKTLEFVRDLGAKTGWYDELWTGIKSK